MYIFLLNFANNEKEVTATGLQATIECGFTLKRVRDMTRTYSQTKKKPNVTILMKYAVLYS